MPELLQAYWPYILIAFVIGLAVAWFAFAANRKTAIKRDEGQPRDVLDEGAEPARRNQALIDGSTKSSDSAQGTPIETPSSVPQSEPSAAPPRSGTASGDDLTRIKGLGPKLSVLLNELGITTYAQIAAWSDADIDRIDAQLGRFEGRIRRDAWVDQAKLLCAGEEDAFSQEFGQNG